MILIDTDIMVDILRGYTPAIECLTSLGDEEILLPGFVVMALIQGCRNKIEQEKVQRVIEDYEVTWPSATACNEALSEFAQFRLSHGIGIIDILIGQMAVELDIPLSAFNQKHYAPVPNLLTLQPYVK
ncbi:PilT protein domain protein [Syntrophobacter sp. SbD1]|nr:PilT protein domain protein [Syntrophobacter sp. SbD1]